MSKPQDPLESRENAAAAGSAPSPKIAYFRAGGILAPFTGKHLVDYKDALEIIGDGEKAIKPSAIPQRHFDKTMIEAHGLSSGNKGTATESHKQSELIEGNVKSIDNLLQIMRATTPDNVYISSCYGGAMGNDIEKNFEHFEALMGARDRMSINIMAPSNNVTMSTLGEDYFRRILNFRDATETLSQEVAISRHNPETQKRYDFVRAKDGKVKLLICKICAPKSVEDIDHPETFIGSWEMYGKKFRNGPDDAEYKADKAKRQNKQIVFEGEDPADPDFIEWRDKIIAEMNKEPKEFSKEYAKLATTLATQRGKPELLKKWYSRLDEKEGMAHFEAALHSREGSTSLVMQQVQNLMLKTLLEAATPKMKQRALFYSIERNDSAVFEAAIKAGADINGVDDSGNTPLHYAIYSDRDKLIELGPNMEIINAEGVTALYLAASNGKSHGVKYLRDKGAKIDTTNRDGKSMLRLAEEALLEKASSDGVVVVVEGFVALGIDINMVVNAEGKTALHLAAENGHKGMVESLLRLKAMINQVDDEGKTALHLAAENGHKEALQKLLSARASSVITDNSGMTASRLALNNNHPEIAGIIREYDQDPKKDIKDFHQALASKDAATIEALLKKDVDVNAPKDKKSWRPINSAIISAIITNDTKFLDVLLSPRVDVNHMNPTGKVAVIAAAKNAKTV